MLYLGIDPGISGGMCLLEGDSVKKLVSMPQTELGILDFIMDSKAGFAILEKVWGYVGPNNGVMGNPGSAMFKFGTNYGGIKMALFAAGVGFEEIAPQVWQKKMNIASRERTESQGQFKNRLKSKAESLFPKVKVTLATADAALIAEFCRRKRTGTL